jgi:anti-sigma factor ChrR (cupin superfamily)
VAHPRREVLAALAAFIDGRVDSEESVELILHLSTCPRCRKVISQSVTSSRSVLLEDEDEDSPLE